MTANRLSEGFVHCLLEAFGAKRFLGLTQQCVFNFKSGASGHMDNMYDWIGSV